jgi:O-antigen/teichoic acid export membrane protein
VWALVAQQLSVAIIKYILLYIVSTWRPKLVFELGGLNKMFEFGSKLMIASFIGTVFNNAYSLVIGKLFNPTELAFYAKSKQIPWIIMNTTSGTISSVVLPTLSKLGEDDLVVFKSVVKRILKVTYFIMMPIMVILIVNSHALVIILLTEKWLPIVPYMQLMVVHCLTLPIQGINSDVYNSLGRSDLYLKLELIRKILLILTLFVTFRFGVYGIVLGQVVCGVICVFVNGLYAKSLIRYSVVEQLEDIASSIINSIVMGLFCYGLLSLFVGNYIVQITCVGISGLMFYLLLSYFTKQESLFYLIELIMPFLRKNKDSGYLINK